MISGFSSAGVADRGYMAAGFVPIGAVEIVPEVCEVYRANVGPHIRCEDITTTDWRTFDRPDLLHMSPVCTRASSANPNKGETALDLALADAICRALETLTPKLFVLENVREYRRFASFGRILAMLERLGYYYDARNVNAADFGVPQTRRRLIVRAVRGGLVPHLPPPVRWVGWYAAIADIIPTLPESAFAPWQLARLPEWLGESTLVHPTETRRGGTGSAIAPSFTVTGTHGMPRTFLIGGGNTQLAQVGSKARDCAAPAFTVTGSESATRNQRAFIVDDQHNNRVPLGLTVRESERPVFTISSGANKPARAWLDQGHVVAMTPRALARFQSIPDDFALPDSRGLACRIVGNAVPSLLAQRIGESLLGVL